MNSFLAYLKENFVGVGMLAVLVALVVVAPDGGCSLRVSYDDTEEAAQPAQPDAKPEVQPAPERQPEPAPVPEPNPRVVDWFTDKAMALAEAEKFDGVVVGFYSHPTCGPCKQLATYYLETVQFRRRCVESRIVPYYVEKASGSVPRLVVCSDSKCTNALAGWKGVEVTDDWLRRAAEAVR